MPKHTRKADGTVWATVIALAYLRTCCAGLQGEWSLIAGKAQAWLLAQTGVTPALVAQWADLAEALLLSRRRGTRSARKNTAACGNMIEYESFVKMMMSK